ncbi:substrate-binding domain-containing protein [Synechococcus sp. RSCCF101]|uniref:substrate-binding domain-containing protein n=1 Tax=Synechococcus sp. RSCCF101 TaxID=2511069 RepID=UPI002107D8B3|nr:substrate-binding domain-containing protein [Synechococcus sp. RSCCF101]
MLQATDPLRSNSGQLALALWARAHSGAAEGEAVSLWKRSLYQPPRSTDILLREFIAAGPNDGDLAFVYESNALIREPEATRQQGQTYRILYPDPTYETVLAAGVLSGEARGRRQDAERLIALLLASEGQELLQRSGFRSAAGRPPAAVGAAGEAAELLPPPSRPQLDALLRLYRSS